MVDENCHNKQFVTISGVTISGKYCMRRRREGLQKWEVITHLSSSHGYGSGGRIVILLLTTNLERL